MVAHLQYNTIRIKYIRDEKSELFVKTYRSFLSAEGEMSIDQIIRLYQQMDPSLHKGASSSEVDFAAFIYAFLRLPVVMGRVKKIVLAQTDEIFERAGFVSAEWEEVDAPARRRKMFFDREDTLAIFINSVTDMDDIVGLLTAFQIEWNNMHDKLQTEKVSFSNSEQIQKVLGVTDEFLEKLSLLWRDTVEDHLVAIQAKKVDFHLTLLRGSYIDYKKAAQQWFDNIVEVTRYKDLRSRPIYFVSSNTHSLVNTITGWVNMLEEDLLQYLRNSKMETLLEYWEKINTGEYPGSKENFLWYILKKYEKEYPEAKQKRIAFENELGIDYIEAHHYLDINVQVLSLSSLVESDLPKKLHKDLKRLQQSDALLVNIDYPLGFGAYMVLSTFLQNVSNVKGIYILGKASFLNGSLGDIGLPTTIYDVNSKNTYIIKNAFSRKYFSEFKSGSILTDQKSLSAEGTLLYSEDVIQEYFLQDFTIVEMENGSYLNAVYETTKYDRYPENETTSLFACPIDIGIIHYASDTPFTKAITLGTRNLGYEGVEATYVSSLAILKRIIEVENK